MCGLLGEYSFDNSLSEADAFCALLSLSKHRGPDSTDISTGENYRLGFNRLALLDISPAGDQPRKSPSQRYHLVFNGEIYNYKELIASYQMENLASSSDTEMVLHLLDRLGVAETVKVLNGMFALAIVDTLQNELWLARDFAGIKPLYYGLADCGVAFASQFDQVFKHPWFSKTITFRPETVHEYFAFGYMAAPNTIYSNIFQVNPGTLLKIDSEGKITHHNFNQFPKKTEFNPGYDLDTLRSAISKSVGLQLYADRSIATFLSGGMDSTLVSSYAKEQKNDIEAFTLKVNDHQLDESGYAKTYAEHLDLDHKILEVDEGTLLTIIKEHFTAFSEPFGDYSSLPTYGIAKMASQYHTAMLSGDGGDELFWGYPRMLELMQKSAWFKLPLFFRKNILRITNRLKITHTYAPYKKDLGTYWMDWHIKIPRKVLNAAFEGGFSKEMAALYAMDKSYTQEQLQHFLRWNEFYGHLQRILIKVDRTSMKNSLEVRIPFLDQEVIDQSWRMFYPIEDFADLKKPLKQLLGEKIPQDLLMADKKGFSVPIERWFRHQLKPDLIQTVLESDLYGSECFDQEVLKNYVKDFLQNKHDNGWGVWHIYAWQKWADGFH